MPDARLNPSSMLKLDLDKYFAGLAEFASR